MTVKELPEILEYRDILDRASHLPRQRKIDLLAELANQIREKDNNDKKRSIGELRGLGKEIWQGIDAQEYVNQERDSWDG